MATTTVSDAVVSPQDQGTGLSSNDDAISAGLAALLAQHSGGEHHHLDLSVDASANTVDVSSGVAYVADTTSTDVQSASGSGFDTTLPTDHVYLVVLPTAVTGLALSTDAAGQEVWLSVDPTAQNAVTIHHDETEPADPSIKLGEADTSAGSAVHWTRGPTNRSVFPGGATSSLTPIAAESGSGQLDHDYQNLPPHDAYVLEIWFDSQNGNDETFLRVNGQNTADYSGIRYEGNTPSGDDRWEVMKADGPNGDRGFQFLRGMVVGGRETSPDSGNATYPRWGTIASSGRATTLVTGSYNVGVPRVDELNVWGAWPNEWRHAVYGYDFAQL